MIVAELLGSAEIWGRPEILGSVSVDGVGFDGSVDVDGSLADVLFRTTGPVQRVGIEVYVDGVLIPARELVGPVTVDQSMDSHEQAAGFTLALRNPDGYFGNPLDTHGAAFGTASVDVYGLFWTPGGDRRIPLLTNGVAHSVGRKTSGGRQEPYTVVDAMGRVDHLTVTLSIPAGAGLRRDEIAGRIAAQLGIEAVTFAPCGQVYRVAEFVDADPIRALQGLFDVEGRVFFLKADGALVNPSLGLAPGQGPLWTFTERDILKESLQADGPSEVVTDITLTGTEQILHPADEAPAAGSETTPNEVTIEDLYQVVEAAYTQGGGGTLTPRTSFPDPREQIVSRTRTLTEKRGGEVVTELSVTESFRMTERTRYVYAGGGVRNFIPGVFLLADADPAGGGSEPAYEDSTQLFRETAQTLVRHYFDDPQYLGPPSTPGSAQAPWGNHFQGTPQSTGVRLGKITEAYGWYLPAAALKAQVPGTTWEAVDPIVGVETRGDGRAAVGHAESYMLTSREVEIITVTPDKYVKSTAVYTFGWFAGVGNAYWYQGSGPAAQAQESFRLLRKTQTDNIPTTDESGYYQVETVIDYTGNAAPVTKTTRNVGAPPAVDILPSALPDPSVFDTPEQAKAAMIARNTETRTILARVVSEDLEAYHPKRIVKTSVAEAETAQELQDVGRRTIALSAANTVTFGTPFNPALRLADPARVVHRPLGVDATGVIHTLRHSVARPPAQSTTTVTILQMPDGIGFTSTEG